MRQWHIDIFFKIFSEQKNAPDGRNRRGHPKRVQRFNSRAREEHGGSRRNTRRARRRVVYQIPRGIVKPPARDKLTEARAGGKCLFGRASSRAGAALALDRRRAVGDSHRAGFGIGRDGRLVCVAALVDEVGDEL